MSTLTEAVAIPDALAEWRPVCDIFADHGGDCGNAASHALLTHGGCQVRFVCSSCYGRFRAIFAEWLNEKPDTVDVVCATCRAHIDDPWDALHLEPI